MEIKIIEKGVLSSDKIHTLKGKLYIPSGEIKGYFQVVHGMTDTMGRMHGDAQFAGSSSVPAHVEMMGLIGMGNNVSGRRNSCSCYP